MEVLIRTTFQSIILIFIVNVYTKIIKFKDINIKYNNVRISAISALIAVVVSIIMTAIYNKHFINFFPINTVFNSLIVRLILDSPAIICMIINKEKINSAGFTKNNLLKSIFLGFFIGCVYFFTYSTKSLYIVKNINIKLINTIIFLFAYCSIIGLGEEFLYRGYLQTRLISVNGKIKGWILTSIIFSLMHFSQRIIVDRLGIVDALVSCAYLLPMSFLLGYMSMKTKNIMSSAICHTFLDWTSYIFMYIK